jgi:hypothetical protein
MINLQMLMKNFILLAACLLPCLVFGQFDKGQVYLGGTLSTSVHNTPTVPSVSLSNAFEVSPSLNIFLNTKLSLGASIGYSYTKAQVFVPNTGTVVSGTTNTISFSPTARYYLPISSSFYVALQGQVSYSHSNSNIYYTSDFGYGINFNPVFIFFPVPQWGIEGTIGSIGYAKTHYTYSSTFDNNFTLNAGSFSFGVAYYFKRK